MLNHITKWATLVATIIAAAAGFISWRAHTEVTRLSARITHIENTIIQTSALLNLPGAQGGQGGQGGLSGGTGGGGGGGPMGAGGNGGSIYPSPQPTPQNSPQF